ncbi:MAG: DUF177 domain-containing protein [Tenacibaculum sp.]|nr:DUF177 domain-containing protein [Tenacibaculum sp.]
MKDLKDFDIPFIGLKDGSHTFEYHIDKKFFEVFQFDEFNDSNVTVVVNLVKKPTLLEVDFTATGSVNVFCDLTNEPFEQEINGTLPLIIKFGDEFNDDNEDILIIPYDSYKVNIAQYIYELIVLSVPIKRIHPKVADGTLENETLKKLKELEVKKEKSVEETNSTDPRWDKLKDLITGKNT